MKGSSGSELSGPAARQLPTQSADWLARPLCSGAARLLSLRRQGRSRRHCSRGRPPCCLQSKYWGFPTQRWWGRMGTDCTPGIYRSCWTWHRKNQRQTGYSERLWVAKDETSMSSLSRCSAPMSVLDRWDSDLPACLGCFMGLSARSPESRRCPLSLSLERLS